MYKNYSIEKKGSTASILRRLKRSSGGESWRKRYMFDEALSLAINLHIGFFCEDYGKLLH